MRIFYLVITILILLVSVGYFFRKDSWNGFYYPNGCLDCKDKTIIVPGLKDKEACLQWANDIKKHSGNPNDDFECGKNCEDNGEGLNICEETVDF